MTKKLDHVEQYFDYGLDILNREIYLGSQSYLSDDNESGVDFLMADKFIKAFTLLERKNDPILIKMNNPGGYWYHGIAIYDLIKKSKCHVTIQVYGQAFSMGSVILQAADQREISIHSRVMIHDGTTSIGEVHYKTYNNWGAEMKRIKEECDNIFLNRIREKLPQFKKQQLQRMLLHDTILTAKESFDIGLIDRIIE